MAVSATLLLSAEKLRDGGSLAVTFQCADACEYWVLLPVKLEEHIAVGFLAPILVNRTTDVEVNLSWQDAAASLSQLMSIATENCDREFIRRMMAIINTNI